MDTRSGLRERKKRRTRETIVRVALELFAERGYHETTVAEIADAADISPRTVFSYFPSKEEILFDHVHELRDALAQALEERPEGRETLATLRHFILANDPRDRKPVYGQLERIIDADETLRSHKRARLTEIEDLVAAAIARDLDSPAGDVRPRLVAAALTAAFQVLDDTMDDAATDDVAVAIDPVFTFLRAGLAALTTPFAPPGGV